MVDAGALNEPVPIPGKKYFRIGEVSRLTGLKTHTLRYWESEFSIIRPQRASNQRLYRREDVASFLRIKKLIQDDGMTIAGAKKLLARDDEASAEEIDVTQRAGDHQTTEVGLLQQIKKELRELKSILE